MVVGGESVVVVLVVVVVVGRVVPRSWCPCVGVLAWVACMVAVEGWLRLELLLGSGFGSSCSFL